MKNIIVGLLLFSFQAQASLVNPSQKISQLIIKKLNQIEEGLESSDHLESPYLYQGENETAYYLKRIRMQFCPSVAFDIKIFEVKFKPIIEFRWMRKNPVGWQNYKKEL